MRRSVFTLAVAAAALVAPFAGSPATADHCVDPATGSPSNIVIFSSPLGVNSNALVCIVAPAETDQLGYDGRLINPLSTAIRVRYTEDLGADIAALPGVLNGLGFESRAITLERQPFATGGFVYNSPVIEIPGGPTAIGRVTATITLPDATTESNTFHTIGG